MVKIDVRIRCPECGYDNFEPLGWNNAADKLRCKRCGNVLTRRVLGANVVSLDAERRKREMRDKSRKL
jgi:ribosomal protein S27E